MRSQYCCIRVGRGMQPSSISSPTPCFLTCRESQLLHHKCAFSPRSPWTNGPTDQRTKGPTDQWTDKSSYRIACPQLKSRGISNQATALDPLYLLQDTLSLIFGNKTKKLIVWMKELAVNTKILTDKASEASDPKDSPP